VPLDFTDEQMLIQRIDEITEGINDGSIPLWRGDEPIANHLDRARVHHDDHP
jgi:hypothetical protein